MISGVSSIILSDTKILKSKYQVFQELGAHFIVGLQFIGNNCSVPPSSQVVSYAETSDRVIDVSPSFTV